MSTENRTTMDGTTAAWLRWRAMALDAGLLVLRLGAGGMMLVHGWPKLLGFSERSASFPDPLGVGSTTSLALAVSGEVLCSILLVLGAGTRLAAVPYAITMAVAGVLVHAGDPWNDREKAFLFLLLGVVLALTGAGRFSIDGIVEGRRRVRAMRATVARRAEA